MDFMDSAVRGHFRAYQKDNATDAAARGGIQASV